jgi:hypothetical protein
MTKNEIKALKKLRERYKRNCSICKDKSKSIETRKKSVRYASYLAERLGIIKRPKICNWCRQKKYLYRHHWDYEDPVDINFLCKNCHVIADYAVQ